MPYGTETLHNTSKAFWEMLKDDFAEKCNHVDGGRAKWQESADTGAGTPILMSRNCNSCLL